MPQQKKKDCPFGNILPHFLSVESLFAFWPPTIMRSSRGLNDFGWMEGERVIRVRSAGREGGSLAKMGWASRNLEK